MKPVFEAIDDDAQSLQRLLHLKKSPYLLAYWLNVNGKGHMNTPHNHMLFQNHRILFSGVYYIAADD